ncbi:MAG: LpxL/LpxP family Kdo(2)-lipid IV(A) lauroyl/palmitoleoyl acyltransferase, partial [Pseudomonadales bacterium]|nr:LpxL/LpxP family Kdo(2)-lipid IV(A) lauroyl/palmitoleoyl acyltransferase [Pseudomonadales bacterium]
MSWRLLAPRYWPTWLGLALLRVLEPLPHSVHLAMGRGLGRLLQPLLRSQARIAQRNLALCLTERSDDERAAILQQHFASLGCALFETAVAWWGADELVRRLTTISGLEHVERAQRAGRGVLLLSAHFTTIEIGCRALTLHLPLNVMYRPTKNEVLGAMLARNRNRQARRAIPRDDVRTLIKALKDGEVVWYAPDQSYRKKGAEMVPFFGIAAATNTATSRIAAMTNAVVLPYFVERAPDGRHYRGIIGAPLEDFPSDSSSADALSFNRLIEAHVRKVPEQYLWIHRRFKGLDRDYPNYYGRRSAVAKARRATAADQASEADRAMP